MEDVQYLREGFKEGKSMEVPVHPGRRKFGDSLLLNRLYVDFKVSDLS